MIVYLVEMDGRFETADDYNEYDNWFVGVCSTLEKAQNKSIAYLKDECAEYGVEVDDQAIEHSKYDDSEHHRYYYEIQQGQTVINCCVSITAVEMD